MVLYSLVSGELFRTLLVLVCHFYHFSQAAGIAQDNERSSEDHGAVLEALERAPKATEAAFSEMADG
jgi:hypothetical protein